MSGFILPERKPRKHLKGAENERIVDNDTLDLGHYTALGEYSRNYNLRFANIIFY